MTEGDVACQPVASKDPVKNQVPVPPPGMPIPTKRLRQKTSLVPVPEKPQRASENLKGNKNGRGKKKMATIAQKERIMSTYEGALKEKVKKPLKLIQNLPGYFPGCIYESKWGKVRREQRWDVFVATAPQLCGKFKELPNSLRRILKISTMKASPNPKANNNGIEQVHLPLPLQTAVDDMISERLELGEEVTMSYCKRVLEQGVTLWNQVVTLLNSAAVFWFRVLLSGVARHADIVRDGHTAVLKPTPTARFAHPNYHQPFTAVKLTIRVSISMFHAYGTQ